MFLFPASIASILYHMLLWKYYNILVLINLSSLCASLAASQSMHSQIQNQAQQLPTPVVSNIYQQHILSQNTQNNIQSTGVLTSTGLTHSMPPVAGMSQGTMSNVSVENPNMQNLSNVTPNAVLNSIWLDVPANMYGNSQRQIPGAQQQVVSQDTQQHSQNPVVNSLQSNGTSNSIPTQYPCR